MRSKDLRAMQQAARKRVKLAAEESFDDGQLSRSIREIREDHRREERARRVMQKESLLSSNIN